MAGAARRRGTLGRPSGRRGRTATVPSICIC